MAAEMEKDNGIKAELIAGGGGIFEVIVDGTLLYDKAKTGGFPKPGEMAELVRRHFG